MKRPPRAPITPGPRREGSMRVSLMPSRPVAIRAIARLSLVGALARSFWARGRGTWRAATTTTTSSSRW